MEKKQSQDSLTGLKGIFIFIIVLFHTMPDTEFINKIPFTSFIGIYGGDLGNFMFFMLSGFLMSSGYQNRISNREISFADYIKKRLCKLYPIYILSNSVMLIAETVQYGLSAINLKKIIMTILLQCGGGLDVTHPYNGPSWFVSALIICYIVHYFILYAAKNKTQYACMIVFSIIWGYSIAIEGWTPPIAFGRCGIAFLNYFVGCAVFDLLPKIPQKFQLIFQITAILTVAFSIILMLYYGVEIISGNYKVAFTFLLCPLLLYISVEKNPVSHILKSKPILYLGKISVFVYFWHFVIYVIFRFCYQIIVNSPMDNFAFGLYLILLVLFCSVLNHFSTHARAKQ